MGMKTINGRRFSVSYHEYKLVFRRMRSMPNNPQLSPSDPIYQLRCNLPARLLVSITVLLLGISGAFASDRIKLPPESIPPSVHEGVVNTVEGVAVKGYDVVAYFTDGKAVLGDPDITARYDGADWRFISEAHRKAFIDDPAKYEPDFGGFCAYAVAHGTKADIDPAAYTIVNGRLYLNYSIDIRTMWRKDLPTELANGDKNWPTVKDLTEVLR